MRRDLLSLSIGKEEKKPAHRWVRRASCLRYWEILDGGETYMNPLNFCKSTTLFSTVA